MKKNNTVIASTSVLALVLAMTAGLILFFSPAATHAAEESPWEILARIPVQHDGRVKPFESFAREAVFLVTGAHPRSGSKAAETLWRWKAEPEIWNTKPIIPVSFRPLREEFQTMLIENRLSPELILNHQPFLEKVQTAGEKQQRKEPLLPVEKESLSLYEKAMTFRSIATGAMPGWIPHPEDPLRGWFPLNSFAAQEDQIQLAALYDPVDVRNVNHAIRQVLTAMNQEGFAVPTRGEAVQLEEALKKLYDSRGVFIDSGLIRAELGYNRLNPFGWSWKFYLAAVLMAMIGGILRIPRRSFGSSPLRITVLVLPIFLGFILHSYGFYLRCLISGRPPVTNMYESIVWVSWAAVLFSIVFFLIYRALLIPLTAAIVASFALLVAENFPAVLSPAISPLVPVLRSNLWLTVHVLTITLSYGAFALAWGLGHFVVYRFAFVPKKKEQNLDYSQFLYRTLQIGVILLASGTVLGGVWANYSWGRFWGWDPKETWALIALLGYLTVLHGRSAGWLSILGTAAGAVFAFLLIVMAWYGVNFVLAAGLHSYGFGGGGAPYVGMVALADSLLVLWMLTVYRKRVRVKT